MSTLKLALNRNLKPAFAPIAIRIGTLVRYAFVAVIVALAGTGTAHATPCTMANTPTTISFGKVAVPRDAPVGSYFGPTATSTVTVNCQAGSYYLSYYPALQFSQAVTTVWETGMAGVGVEVRNATFNNFLLSFLMWPAWAPIITSTNDIPTVVTSPTVFTYIFTYRLVKTAATTGSGALTVPSMFSLASKDLNSNVTGAQTATTGIGNTTIVASTCTVTTPTITVTLPKISTSQLSSVGAKSGDTAFRIGLSCNAGYQLYVTLTDATTPSNQTDQLTLVSGSTARGVKLRVLRYDGTSVAFGPASAVAGNTNQWLVGDSGSTTMIPLVVQYISTGTVTPGTVKGATTFTLSYQ